MTLPNAFVSTRHGAMGSSGLWRHRYFCIVYSYCHRCHVTHIAESWDAARASMALVGCLRSLTVVYMSTCGCSKVAHGLVPLINHTSRLHQTANGYVLPVSDNVFVSPRLRLEARTERTPRPPPSSSSNPSSAGISILNHVSRFSQQHHAPQSLVSRDLARTIKLPSL